MSAGPGDRRDNFLGQLGHARPSSAPRHHRVREFRHFRYHERNFVIGIGTSRDLALTRLAAPSGRGAAHAVAAPRTAGEAETW